VAAVKERLREWHKERRLVYANAILDWTLVDWARVTFIDEFTIFSGDAGRLWVWRETGTRFDARNIAHVDNVYRHSVSFIALYVVYKFYYNKN
jgi:hypothetical protein